MQRIQDTTAAASLPATPALTGPIGYFTGGSPGSVAATRVRAWFLNMIQEELLAILTAGRVTPDTTGTVFNQVVTALNNIIQPTTAPVRLTSGSGNWTALWPAIKVTVIGGGGGGGGGDQAGGGGGGAVSVLYLSGLTVGVSSLAYVVGALGAGSSGNGSAGGDSTFNDTVTSHGGAGGLLGNAGTVGTGGAGGTATGGTYGYSGGNGAFGMGPIGGVGTGGQGGANGLGQAGAQNVTAGVGAAAILPGTGGAGGANGSAGGNGAAGIIIIEPYSH